MDEFPRSKFHPITNLIGPANKVRGAGRPNAGKCCGLEISHFLSKTVYGLLYTAVQLTFRESLSPAHRLLFEPGKCSCYESVLFPGSPASTVRKALQEH